MSKDSMSAQHTPGPKVREVMKATGCTEADALGALDRQGWDVADAITDVRRPAELVCVGWL